MPPDTALTQTQTGYVTKRPATEITLEFELGSTLLDRLLRAPAVAARRDGSASTAACNLIWHDTADGALAQAGLALCQGGKAGVWRLERLHPAADATGWLPAHLAPVLEEAAAQDGLRTPLPGKLAPAAAFAGRLRQQRLHLPNGPGRLSVLCGTLRGVAEDQPSCRVMLSGAPADAAGLAATLAETLDLTVPRRSLAAQAMALARSRPSRPRHTGAPVLPPGVSATGALACITAHLSDVILHWADLVPQAATPEPVHQMRVAVRRLRSALTAFRHAARDDTGACPWLDELAAVLRTLAARLGVARDWDVFLSETGAEVVAAFPQDRRISQLIAAAGRKRLAAYADLAQYLGSQEWTHLSMRLALLPTLRPWDEAGDRHMLDGPAADYAVRALDRRLKHVLAPGNDLTGLAPSHLHDIRKQAKRLRYATEFFAPLFAEKHVRKYLPRLEALQAVLGAVNDTEVAAGLTAQLAGGADRAFAAGVVQGFGAARAGRAAGKVQRAWCRFTRASPFWD